MSKTHWTFFKGAIKGGRNDTGVNDIVEVSGTHSGTLTTSSTSASIPIVAPGGCIGVQISPVGTNSNGGVYVKIGRGAQTASSTNCRHVAEGSSRAFECGPGDTIAVVDVEAS